MGYILNLEKTGLRVRRFGSLSIFDYLILYYTSDTVTVFVCVLWISSGLSLQIQIHQLGRLTSFITYTKPKAQTKIEASDWRGWSVNIYFHRLWFEIEISFTNTSVDLDGKFRPMSFWTDLRKLRKSFRRARFSVNIRNRYFQNRDWGYIQKFKKSVFLMLW
jgi:hypothetical protein